LEEPPSRRKQTPAAVQGKFQAIARTRWESLLRLLRSDVNDGHRPFLRIGGPDLLAVWRKIKTFGAAAGWDVW